MRVPGFAAEASLYEANEHYLLAQTWSRKAGSPAIVPSYVRCICSWSICVFAPGPPLWPTLYHCPPLNCFCTKRQTQARDPGFLHE
jgi:hypothetical protein